MTDNKIIELKKALYKPAFIAYRKCFSKGIYCRDVSDFVNDAVAYIFLSNSQKFLDNESNFYYIIRQGIQQIYRLLLEMNVYPYSLSIERQQKRICKKYLKNEDKNLLLKAWNNFEEQKCQIIEYLKQQNLSKNG